MVQAEIQTQSSSDRGETRYSLRARDIRRLVPEAIVRGDLERVATSICHDSRQSRKGACFVCVRGLTTDGHAFAKDAVAAGAGLVVAEEELLLGPEVTTVIVPNTRRLLGPLASAFYRDPSKEMTVLGITGTNGKTTTCHMIRNVLRSAGFRTGLLGTVIHEIGGKRHVARHTTPDGLELQQLMAEARDWGTTHLVMEVSSHALELDRVLGTDFSVVIFTNLTRDHLDFHGGEEPYFNAKAKLFLPTSFPYSLGDDRAAVINVDDPRGMELARITSFPHTTYALKQEADCFGEVRDEGLWGSRMELRWKGVTEVDLEVRMAGQGNAYNALAAAAAARLLDVNWSDVAKGIGLTEWVPGRMEVIRGQRGATAVVDYAHTPDALERLLVSLRPSVRGDLITVFGCGGDRDRGKRPQMGEIAARLSDRVIVTSDNPRTEDPVAIIEDIASGMPAEAGNWVRIEDRKEAITMALESAKEGDVVVVAGKGHEDYQIVGREIRHFSDREVVEKALGVVSHNDRANNG